MAWKDILGHEFQAEILKNSWKAGRLGQAYFFHGPEGIGKRTFAYELAKGLLCENRLPDLEACQECPSCELVKAGNHPDLHYASLPLEAHEFPIELMREQCEHFILKSFRGGYRVLILDDCDKLNEESANCFLKRLEEPPPKFVLFLLGSSLEKQLETVLSRCQIVAFNPLSLEQLKGILSRAELGQGVHLEKIADLAEGSPGLALRISKPEFLQTRDLFLKEMEESSPDGIRMAKIGLEFSEGAGKATAEQRGRAIWLVHTVMSHFRSLNFRNLRDGAAQDTLIHTQEKIKACLTAEERLTRRMQISLAIEAWVEELNWPANSTF